MGRVRKTARFFFSIGGYDGISPIAKESTREKLLREQNELIAKQTRLLEGTEVRREMPAQEGVWHLPGDDTVNYYPVAVPGSGQLHLIYGDMPDAPTLCGKSAAQDVLEALSIDDVTCAMCRAVAGDFGGPPKSPFILTGRCPKCSRPVVWYKQRDKTPVHIATGKFECPADADSEKGAPAAAGLDSQEGTGVAAELDHLAALHSSGALDDEEFRAAKARIIHGG